nr:MAG TPA: hypothetical protein [Caudoviricetes sp.]
MKTGSTYKASDGSTWKKESDGSVTVTSKDGTVSKNAYTASSSGSSTGGSGNSRVNGSGSSSGGGSIGKINTGGTAANNTYTIGTPKGNDLYNTAKTTGTASFKDKGGDTVVLKYDKNTGKMTAIKNGVSMNVNNTYKAQGAVSSSTGGTGGNNAAQTQQGNVSGGNTPQGGRTVYSVNGKAPSGLRAGDMVITGGGTYKITGLNEDGTYQSQLVDANNTTSTAKSIDFQRLINDAVSRGDWATAALYEQQRNAKIDKLTASGQNQNNYQKTYNYSTVATDSAGKQYNVVTQQDGTLKLIGSDGSSPSDLFGIITVSDPNNSQYKKQYIATNDNGKTGKLVAISNSPVSVMQLNEDGSYDATTLRDADGNAIDSGDLVYGSDGLSYLKSTGESLGQIAQRMGLDTSNYAFAVGRGNDMRYYTLNGEEITGANAGLTKEWTQDKLLDKLYNAIMDAGYNNVPKLSDYDTLTWEQALAQAGEQMNSQYDKQLDNTLDSLNQKALETGFYGQLPTEALRQQAAASNEVERQSAINDLARSLMSDSRDYAQTQLTADTQTSQNRVSTIQQIYNMLAEYRQQELENALKNAQTQQEYDQVQQGLINDAVQLYIQAINAGVDPSQAYAYAKSRMGK